MKKILFGLMVAVSLSSASAQEITCQSVPGNADEYIPSLCDHTRGALPGDDIELGPLHVVRPATEPKMDWNEAKKICDAHIIYEELPLPDDAGTTHVSKIHYEDGFVKPCNAVDDHSVEEKRREDLAKKIKQEVQSVEDLNRLNDFLARGAAK